MKRRSKVKVISDYNASFDPLIFKIFVRYFHLLSFGLTVFRFQPNQDNSGTAKAA